MNTARAASMASLGVVVMAAGRGTRMQSNHAKVLHRIAGRPMIHYALDVARHVAGHSVAVVVGHQADAVRQAVDSALSGPRDGAPVHIVEQTQQLGTGHAVLQARPVFVSGKGKLPAAYLILNGDTPLLQETTVQELLRVHHASGATVTMLTALLDDPSGYGRVVRRAAVRTQDGLSASGDVVKIVEHRDATPEERAIREINVGTYVVDGGFLFAALDKVEPHNAQGEYYLTDIVDMAVTQGHRVSAMALRNPDEGLGVNTRQQLADAEGVIRQQIRARWLEAGVTMVDPSSTWIEAGVVIGQDTILHPHVTLEGLTVIGEGTTVYSGVRISDCVVGNRVEILDHCVLHESQIDDEAHIGPFVHLRPGVRVRQKAKVGNFVEMKKTDLGEGAKANHLSYLGDATIGKGVNIGAGTITCNYDGVHKHRTVIGDHVFIGSDTQLVAPVTIGAGTVIAAGTTVTQDVPSDSLVIARVQQVTRAGWAAKRRALQAGGTRETKHVKGETASARLAPRVSPVTKKQPLNSKGKPVKKRTRG
ncbi:MAG: bifunctional UDP-N-acetylglucosamine diphosphorylase/glucosamine-1-phosphate N-acetyltransferase GlmU [Nitrospira sp.]|jgi:bifunctional UDP-N-acetylglucosamine pyrophosphorylase/glucosamine-1-phosphate N-acetyltransferase|nr:bifunctional UDP-N-acetylglucosamine diphosphorylase/glucosamine-1-phosphate N-acetyltransferase GlmU [Nitrospira sp.]